MAYVFDYLKFITLYPEFANYRNQASVTIMFQDEAVPLGKFLIQSFPSDVEKQYYYLQLILCHIIYCDDTNISGRVASASSGSDNVSFDSRHFQSFDEWMTSPYGRRVARILRNTALGGYMITNDVAYDSNSMNGAYGLGVTDGDMYGY